MVLLAVDPSIVDTGFAFLRDGEVFAYGSLKTDPKLPLDERLRAIHAPLKDAVKKYKPSVLAIESQYISLGKGAGILKTTEVMGMVEGMFLSYKKDGIITHIHPKSVKSFLGLAPRAKRDEAKDASLKYVSKLLGRTIKNNNESDAVLIGLTYYEGSKTLSKDTRANVG